MGASGSAWIKPKKRRGLRSDAITNAPHPCLARPGQRFFPLASRAKNVVTLKVIRVVDGCCDLKREDDAGRIVRAQVQRLLAVGEDGAGRYYRFIGYAERQYATHAVVIDTSPAWARIVLPEWHPEIPVTVATRALPSDSRTSGVWLSCRANLGADAPARVQPARFAGPVTGFDPTRLHPVDAAALTAVPSTAASSASTPDDLVLFVGDLHLDEARSGSTGVYLTGHPPPRCTGARAYLHADGEVQGWREVGSVRAVPNGTRVVLRGPWHPIAVDAELRQPPSAMAAGRSDLQQWCARSWSRSDERMRPPDAVMTTCDLT